MKLLIKQMTFPLNCKHFMRNRKRKWGNKEWKEEQLSQYWWWCLSELYSCCFSACAHPSYRCVLLINFAEWKALKLHRSSSADKKTETSSHVLWFIFTCEHRQWYIGLIPGWYSARPQACWYSQFILCWSSV